MSRARRPDPYAVLQVVPDASPDEVADAYQRLEALYSADRYIAGPLEFAQQAAARRQELADAYQTIIAGGVRSRPKGTVDEIDYRPLPPARGQERPAESVPNIQPVGVRGEVRRLAPAWGLALIGAVVFLLFLAVTLPGVRTYGAAAAPPPALPGLTLPYTSAQIEALRRTSERSPSAESWTALGNALFDNIEILREVAPDSPQYAEAARRWPEVTQIYERALQGRDDPAVRMSMALSLLYYGNAVNDAASRTRGSSEAAQAWAAGRDNPAVALRYGLALVAVDPPQTETALATWSALVARSPASTEARQAQTLINSYTP